MKDELGLFVFTDSFDNSKVHQPNEYQDKGWFIIERDGEFELFHGGDNEEPSQCGTFNSLQSAVNIAGMLK